MKKVLALVLVLMMAVSVASLAGAEGEIVIGAFQDLSGTAVQAGMAMDQGAQLAIEDINAAGGINGKMLKYVCYDTKNDVQEAMNAFTRLVEQDKAVAVVGPPVSNQGNAMKEMIQTAKVPVMGAWIDSRITKNEATGAAEPYLYLVQPTNIQTGELLASYAVDVLGLKKIALFYDQTNSFGVSQLDAFKGYLTTHGGEVVADEPFKKGDKDFKTQLTKIMAAGAEAIFAPNYPADNALYCTQLNQMGMTDIVTIGGLDYAPPFLKSVSDKSVVDNVYFALNCAFDEPQLQELNAEFVKKFMKEGDVVDDDTISVKVYLGYDSVMLLAEAIRRVEGEVTGEKINAALETIEGYECKTGAIGFSAASHQPVGLSMVMYKIEKGVNVNLGRYVPEIHKAK